jgi:glycosyltransferase involved in cell wall biosynthesis
MARRHRVWAITRRKNEPAISAELRRTSLPNLEMVYFDLPRPVLALKKGALGIDAYYWMWQHATRRVVEDLDRNVRLDLTQHVTFGRYWGPTSLAYLPSPFVWGPVGGGETAPASFHRDFDLLGRTYETLRDCARRCGESAPSVRRAAQRAALGLAVTEETRARMRALGTNRVELFSAMGIDRAAYESFRQLPAASDGPIRFVSMGRLLHWKGFHLGLKAFAATAVPRSEYWIVGDGPQRAQLSELVERLGLSERVRFCGSQPRAQALATLASCHVMVHPSLHDSGGWVCLEAMAAAKPVICLDLGGPSEQVTDQTGIRVPAMHPEQSVADLAQAMTALGTNPELRRALGEAGRKRVEDEYIWEKKGDRLEALYASVLASPARSPVPRA